jgi:autotransporter-associated beta strand protein
MQTLPLVLSRRFTFLIGIILAFATSRSAHGANVGHTLTTTGANNLSSATWTGGAPTNLTIGDMAIYGTGTTASTTTIDVATTIGGFRTNGTGLWTLSSGAGVLTLDATGLTSGNSPFGNAGTAFLANTSSTAGGLTMNSNFTLANTNLDIGGTNSGSVIVGGNIIASTAQSINFRGSGTGNAAISIAGSIGASGSNIAISNLVINAAPVTISGALGASVTSLTQNAMSSVLTLTGVSTDFAGPVNVNLGTLTLNGTGTLPAATAINVSGVGTSTSSSAPITTVFFVGSNTGTGVANRINPNAALNLGGTNGGGTIQILAGATGPVNSQSFTSLNIGTGINQLNTSSTTNAGTFAFSGANAYTRSLGGVVRFNAVTPTFTTAPSGASNVIGAGSSAILIGAVYGASATTSVITDFVNAQGGAAIAAPAYVNTSTASWASGNNTNVDGSQTVTAGSTTQSLRFNDTVGRTTTLSGLSTIESGGILVTSNAVSSATGGAIQSITGGTLQAGSGRDLWIHTAGSTGASDLRIDSLIGDNASSALTKSGARILYLTNASNSYAGGTYLNEGTLNITSGGALGATSGALNFFGNATLQAGAANIDLGLRAITVASSARFTTTQIQAANFNTNGYNMTAGGVISGAGGITKTGNGTLTLTGANLYTGATNPNGGTLKLDFSAAGAPTTNIIAPASLFSPGGTGGTVVAQSITTIIQGKDGVANSQTFSGTQIGKGLTRLNLIAGAGGTLTVNLGAIVRGGISSDSGNAMNVNIPASGVTVNASGAFPNGYITVNDNTWATITSGALVGLGSYATSYAAAATGQNFDATTSGTLFSGAVGARDINTLRFNTAAPTTVTLDPTGLRRLANGGILVTANVGNNPTIITGGVLAGMARRDFSIFQNNTANVLQIESTLTDFNGGATLIAKHGAGTLILTGSQAHTGATQINEGTVQVLGDVIPAPTGITGAITTGTNQLTVSSTAGIVPGMSVTSGSSLGNNNSLSTHVISISGNVVTLSANAVADLASGSPLTFTAMGGLGGGATVQHIVAQGATLQIGNGGTTGALLTGQTIQNNGSLFLNRSDNTTFANVISGIGSLEKQGAGNTTLSVASSFTGDTKISGGSVILASTTALQNSTLDYNSYGGTLSFGALTSTTLGGLKGNQNLVLSNTTPAAVSLTVGGNGQSTSYSGSLSGLGSLTKNGAGTLTLEGANNHAGTTIVNAGTLLLTGSISGGNTLTVGNSATTPATFTLAGTGSYSNVAGRDVIIGNAGNTAVLNVVSGTSLTSNANGLAGGGLALGQVTNSSGVVNQTGGAVALDGQLVLGAAAGSYGFYNQSGGTMNHTGLGTSNSRLRIGSGSVSAAGLYYLSGGTASYTGGDNVIGVAETRTVADGNDNAIGVLYIKGTGSFTGGANTVLSIANNALGGGSGTNNSLTGQLTIGGAGSTAASMTVLSVNTASASAAQPGNSSINLLSGGTLTTGNITKNANGTSNLNFNGGTLKVGTGATTLSNTLTGVYSYAGGATVDTNSLNYTIDAPILAPTGSGVSSITIADGGADYVGAPAVVISGGTGTGATAIAQVTDGKVSSIVITNPGSGYAPSDVLTVAVTGGGFSGNNSATFGTVTLATNTSGGLTKNSAGTLTLSAGTGSTYTGDTQINAGTLAVTNATGSATGTGAVTVANTATLAGNNGSGTVAAPIGAIAGAVTVQSGGLISPGVSNLGTLRVTDLTLEGGSIINLDITTPASTDRLLVAGVFSLSNTSTINVLPLSLTTVSEGNVFDLLDWTTLDPTTFDVGTNFRQGGNGLGDLYLPDITGFGAGSFGWDVSSFLSSGQISVVTIVPEPSRVFLLFVGMAGLLLHRRRK